MHQSRDGEDFEEPKIRSPFGCSFRTFDAIDYTLIGDIGVCIPDSFIVDVDFVVLSATIDVKKNIFDLCADKSDNYLALIEVSLISISLPRQLSVKFCFPCQNQGSVDDLLSLEENVCRLYEVGKQRVEEEADQEEPVRLKSSKIQCQFMLILIFCFLRKKKKMRKTMKRTTMS